MTTDILDELRKVVWLLLPSLYPVDLQQLPQYIRLLLSEDRDEPINSDNQTNDLALLVIELIAVLPITKRRKIYDATYRLLTKKGEGGNV